MGSSQSCTAACAPDEVCPGAAYTNVEIKRNEIEAQLNKAIAALQSCKDLCKIKKRLEKLECKYRKYANALYPYFFEVRIDPYENMYFYYTAQIGYYMVSVAIIRDRLGEIYNFAHRKGGYHDAICVDSMIKLKRYSDCECDQVGEIMAENSAALETGNFLAMGDDIYYSPITRPEIHFVSPKRLERDVEGDAFRVVVSVSRFDIGGARSQKVEFRAVSKSNQKSKWLGAIVDKSSAVYNSDGLLIGYEIALSIPHRRCGRKSYKIEATLVDKCSCDIACATLKVHHRKSCGRSSCDTCNPRDDLSSSSSCSDSSSRSDSYSGSSHHGDCDYCGSRDCDGDCSRDSDSSEDHHHHRDRAAKKSKKSSKTSKK